MKSFSRFYLQLKINSGYPSLLSHSLGLHSLSYNTDLPKTKKLVQVSEITPCYGTLTTINLEFCIDGKNWKLHLLNA